MSSVSYSIAFGLLLIASVLKTLRTVPVPTTTLPPLPARRYLVEPFDKDPFKDYQDYQQDVSKRSLVQQALENAKKFPRPWGMPPPELFDNNFFNPNPYKEQDSRGILETNNIQPNYFEGYFPEDEFSTDEEETNFIEPPYPGDSNYMIEPPQLTYVEQTPLIGSYQQNVGYSSGAYVGNDNSNEETETESDKENSLEEDDNEYENAGNGVTTIAPQPMQSNFPSNNMFLQKPPQQQLKQGMNHDYESVEVESKPRPRDFRSGKLPNKINYPPQTPEPKSKYSKELKSTIEEPPIEKVPKKREVFSRTTTTTKTTTWFLNENNDIVVKEDSDGRPTPLKGKYTKTSKTTTSGPVPWYIQEYEDVIFEEENEKTKTILDKIPYLKGMTPTSITSFTTAPNPWSTEVHEEVVLEESMSKKESVSEAKAGSHFSPLEHIVDYLPRTQAVPDEANTSAEKKVLEEIEEFLEEEEGIIEIFEINIIPEMPPFFPSNMPPTKQYPQFQFQPFPLATPQVQLPVIEKDTFDEEFYAQNGNYQEINPNQVTTQKPLNTPPPMESNFTPHAQLGSLQSTEQQIYPQPSFNYPQPTTQMPQLYGTNQPQQNRDHPGTTPGSRREKWDSPMSRQMGDENQSDPNRIQARIEQDRRDKMSQGKRPMYPNAQQQKAMNRQGRSPRDL